MARLTARIDHGFVRFGLSGHDAAAQWNSWVLESMSPMIQTPPTTAVLFAWSTGQTRANGDLTNEIVGMVEPSGMVIACDDLPPEAQAETALVRAEPFDVTGGLYQGILHQTRGEFAAAMAMFEKVLAAQPKILRVRNLLGMCRRQQNELAAAERAYCDEIELNPGSPDAYCNLGVLYSKQNRQTMARAQFETALERDPFYPNGLIQLTRLAMVQESATSPLIPPLAWRLFALFGDVVQVRQHLEELARAAGQPLDQYRVDVEAKAGVLRDPQLLTIMRRIEILRHNGCIVQVLRGIDCLLQSARGNPATLGFFTDWASRRLAMLPVESVPDWVRQSFTRVRDELMKSWPGLVRETGAASAGPAASTALTAAEFFALALDEIFRDGQLTNDEMQLILRLKNLLRIDAATHQRLFNEVSGRHTGNVLADDAVDFNAERLFARLVVAVARDGRLDASEKKLLDLACEALDINPAARERLLAEQHIGKPQ